MNEKVERRYKAVDLSKGYPTDSHLFYECERCGDILPSMPKDSIHCRCHNISIDIGASRMHIDDRSKVKLFCASAG